MKTYAVELTHEELMTALRALDRDTWRLGDAAHDDEAHSAAERAALAVESDAVRVVRVKLAQYIVGGPNVAQAIDRLGIDQ